MPVTTRSTHRAPDRLEYPATHIRQRIIKRTTKSKSKPTPKTKKTPSPSTIVEATLTESKETIALARAERVQLRESKKTTVYVPKPRAKKVKKVQYKVQTAVMVAPTSPAPEKDLVQSIEGRLADGYSWATSALGFSVLSGRQVRDGS